MRSAISGNDAAYHRLLRRPSRRCSGPARGAARRAPVNRSINPRTSIRDILLAVHLKRHTWDASTCCALAVRDRPQQADRCAASKGATGFRQHRRFRRDIAGRGSAETASASNSPSHTCSRCRRVSATYCSRSPWTAHPSRTRRQVFDDRRRSARWRCIGAHQPDGGAGTMRMDTDQLLRTLAAEQYVSRAPGRLRVDAGAARRGAGLAVDVLYRTRRRSPSVADRNAQSVLRLEIRGDAGAGNLGDCREPASVATGSHIAWLGLGTVDPGGILPRRSIGGEMMMPKRGCR